MNADIFPIPTHLNAILIPAGNKNSEFYKGAINF